MSNEADESISEAADVLNSQYDPKAPKAERDLVKACEHVGIRGCEADQSISEVADELNSQYSFKAPKA
eukprot:527743-Alexandrium_andersonii.AAC.1